MWHLCSCWIIFRISFGLVVFFSFWVIHLECYEIATWLSSYALANGIKIREGNTGCSGFILQMHPSFPPRIQLTWLNKEGELQASRCFWHDWFWPHWSSRCYLLPHCCLVEAGSTFWHWLPAGLTTIALSCWQWTAEAVFPSLYKVHSASGLLIC